MTEIPLPRYADCSTAFNDTAIMTFANTNLPRPPEPTSAVDDPEFISATSRAT